MATKDEVTTAIDGIATSYPELVAQGKAMEAVLAIKKQINTAAALMMTLPEQDRKEAAKALGNAMTPDLLTTIRRGTMMNSEFNPVFSIIDSLPVEIPGLNNQHLRVSVAEAVTDKLASSKEIVSILKFLPADDQMRFISAAKNLIETEQTVKDIGKHIDPNYKAEFKAVMAEHLERLSHAKPIQYGETLGNDLGPEEEVDLSAARDVMFVQSQADEFDLDIEEINLEENAKEIQYHQANAQELELEEMEAEGFELDGIEFDIDSDQSLQAELGHVSPVRAPDQPSTSISMENDSVAQENEESIAKTPTLKMR